MTQCAAVEDLNLRLSPLAGMAAQLGDIVVLHMFKSRRLLEPVSPTYAEP